MSTATFPSQPVFLKKNLALGVTPAMIFLIVIMLLSFTIHIYDIQSIGDANAYYTAAVKSMLQSWNNFFFVAAEPGGSVSVDKPPLGLWIEAAFALVLGVSGFSVSLPNILAGVLGLPVLYFLVKKHAGELAGLVAALVMAVTPVFVATNRNNTMDGMLVFTLLLAAWAFIHAAETGKARWVLLGGFIVGLGFNIKMSQAFLPLPAFYALYFLGSKEGWIRKAANLVAATVLMLVVSLAWAVIVDLTPANLRPYVGSSKDNSMFGLIMEHNGGSRLVGGGGPGGGNPPPANSASLPNGGNGQQPQQGKPPQNSPPQEALVACANLTQDASCTVNLPNGNTLNGTCIAPPNLGQLVCASQRNPNGQNGQSQPNGQNGQPQPNGQNGQPQPNGQNGQPQPNGQNGQPQPNGQNRQGGRPPQEALNACVNQTQGASCSFNALFGTVNGTCIMPPNSTELACAPQGGRPNGGPGGQGGGGFSHETGTPGIFRFFTDPLSKQMSWLLPFALIGMMILPFGSSPRLPLESGTHKALVVWGGWLATCLVFFSAVSGIFHAYYAIMLAPPLGAVVGMGFAQMWNWGKDKTWAVILLIVSAVVTFAFQIFASYQYAEKSAWMIAAGILLLVGIGLTVIKKRAAYVVILAAMLVIPAYWTIKTVISTGDINLPTAYQGGSASAAPQNPPRKNEANQELLTFLSANTQDVEYLVAVPSSMQGAQLVIETGRPVLYMGGFGGQDNVVSAEDLKAMVANKELRYVMYGDERGNKQDIANWLTTACAVVPQFSEMNIGNQPPLPPNAPQNGGAPNQNPQGQGKPPQRNQAVKLYLCQ